MCTSSSNQSIVLHQYYAFFWKSILRCFGLTNTFISTFIKQKEMVEIIRWLLDAASNYKPPSPSNTGNQKVSDSDYLLFSLLLKSHLSEKGPMDPLIAELKRLGKITFPGKEFVGACLFTCHESG
jgi:hypothetical protein